MYFKRMAVCLCSLMLLSLGIGQDFHKACDKLQEGKSFIGCVGEEIPETTFAVYMECLKEQSEKEILDFINHVCENRKELDKWIACQKKKFDSGEFELDDEEKALCKKIETCIMNL